MTDQFVAEIRIFGFNFPPSGWAFCNGQLIPIVQNTALFALIGTFYGGDGKSTFALPDLQGRSPMNWGQSLGTSDRPFVGETGGSETVTLLESEMPVHSHSLMAFPSLVANVTAPGPTVALARSNGNTAYAPPGALEAMAPQAMAPTGGDQPHNNLMPYLVLNFCIALQGVFPMRP